MREKDREEGREQDVIERAVVREEVAVQVEQENTSSEGKKESSERSGRVVDQKSVD